MARPKKTKEHNIEIGDKLQIISDLSRYSLNLSDELRVVSYENDYIFFERPNKTIFSLPKQDVDKLITDKELSIWFAATLTFISLSSYYIK